MSGWLTPRPGRFTPRKETRYPLYRRLGGPEGRSGRVRKTRPHRNSIHRPSSTQQVAALSTLFRSTNMRVFEVNFCQCLLFHFKSVILTLSKLNTAFTFLTLIREEKKRQLRWGIQSFSKIFIIFLTSYRQIPRQDLIQATPVSSHILSSQLFNNHTTLSTLYVETSSFSKPRLSQTAEFSTDTRNETLKYLGLSLTADSLNPQISF